MGSQKESTGTVPQWIEEYERECIARGEEKTIFDLPTTYYQNLTEVMQGITEAREAKPRRDEFRESPNATGPQTKTIVDLAAKKLYAKVA